MGKILFNNGKIFTADRNNNFCEAVLINGNKIIFIGSDQDAKQFISADTEIINLEGKLMLPGFIDAHMHFMWGSISLNKIDLSECKSVLEFRKKIQEYTAQLNYNSGKNDLWLTGGKWDNTKWDIKELPSLKLVDDITSDIPLFIERIDLHMALVNSTALRLAGIDENTPQPEGGVIEKDSTGKLTGILKDSAVSIVKKIIPKPGKDLLYSAALNGLRHLAQFGITSIHDITNVGDIELYRQIEHENKLTCRINTIYPIQNYTDLENELSTEKIRVGALKAFSDGSLGSGTAWFFDDYSDEPGNKGIATDVVLNGSLENLALKADKLGHQLCIHAIGDKANNYVLELFNRLNKENGTTGLRHRLEHAQHLNSDLINRFSELGVIASVQPYHLFDDGSWAEKRIGSDRKRYTYPFRSLINSGTVLSFGTDWTVAPVNPLLGIYAAVTRHTSDGKNSNGWVPEEKITVTEAVRAYTINNAYASFEEDIKGSIETGKFADMIVLSDNIFSIPPEKIKDVTVEKVIFDGQFI